MKKVREVYKCDYCGQMIELLHGGDGTLVCCGQPMKCLEENSSDAAVEKHVPVTSNVENGIRVSVGEIAHPMKESHYIEWIELIDDESTIRKLLKPGDQPEADFAVDAQKTTVRAYCNVHGLWRD